MLRRKLRRSPASSIVVACEIDGVSLTEPEIVSFHFGLPSAELLARVRDGNGLQLAAALDGADDARGLQLTWARDPAVRRERSAQFVVGRYPSDR